IRKGVCAESAASSTNAGTPKLTLDATTSPPFYAGTMGLAFRCETCDVDPHWQVMRAGDVAVTWACDDHLAGVCDRMQRDFEVSELIVKHFAKASEWAAIG